MTEIYQCLVAVYVDCAHNYCRVTRWFNEFTRGHQSLEDDFQSGQSSDAANPISIATAEKLIMTNGKAEVSEIAKELQVLAGSIKNIVHKHLHMLKVSSCWVP